MKFPGKTVLRDLEGAPLKFGPKEKEAELADIAVAALLSDHVQKDGVRKGDDFKLALRITTEPEANLTPEEASRVKELIGQAFNTLTVGRAFAAIDTAE